VAAGANGGYQQVLMSMGYDPAEKVKHSSGIWDDNNKVTTNEECPPLRKNNAHMLLPGGQTVP